MLPSLGFLSISFNSILFNKLDWVPGAVLAILTLSVPPKSFSIFLKGIHICSPLLSINIPVRAFFATWKQSHGQSTSTPFMALVKISLPLTPSQQLLLLCPSSLWRPQDCHLATILPTLSVLLNVHWQRPIPSPTPSTLSTSPRPELMLNPGHNCCGTNSPTPRVSLLIPQPPQKLSLASDTIP